MRAPALGGLAALTLLGAPSAAACQDTTAARPLALDSTRIVAFRREYQMLAVTGDSVILLGTRTVSASPTQVAGAPAWLVIETRTGAVPAAETLYVSSGGRPMQYSARLGASRLAVAFTRDSMLGAVSTPVGRQNFVSPSPADLMTSPAMLEFLLPALTLTEHRATPVSVLSADNAGSGILRGELAVIGEELVDRPGDAGIAQPRPAWIAVVRAPGPRTLLLWVDKQDGAVLRLQQPLPVHSASLLEYRWVGAR
jgi:hypothetical protein